MGNVINKIEIELNDERLAKQDGKVTPIETVEELINNIRKNKLEKTSWQTKK